MKSCALCAWPPRATFAPRCSRPAAEVLVGWEAQTVVAFALFFHNFSVFLGRKGLYLEDLFVRPSYRRRGYGRALLIHLVRIAVDRGCGRFEWAVLGWNAAAIPFYQSLGPGVAAGLAHRSPYRSGAGRPRDRRAGGLVRRASVGELDGASKGCRAHPPACVATQADRTVRRARRVSTASVTAIE